MTLEPDSTLLGETVIVAVGFAAGGGGVGLFVGGGVGFVVVGG